MNEVHGLDELNRKFEMLAKVGEDKGVREGVQGIAEEMRDDMRSRVRVKTGHLRDGIVAKPFRKTGESLSFVAIHYGVAPHAHLVEYGHGGNHPAPPHPFFRPVVDQFQGIYPERMNVLLNRQIQRWWNK